LQRWRYWAAPEMMGAPNDIYFGRRHMVQKVSEIFSAL
jgi:hypothetical protein